MKNALSMENKEVWLSVFQKTRIYILGLKNLHGDTIVENDRRKAGFLGILCNIAAVTSLFVELVENGPMSFLCTYKLEQDPLEHFFGLIRARFGASNNNPTPYQFRNTFRKILLGVTDSIVENGNVVLQETSEHIQLIPLATDKVSYIYENYDFDDLDIEKLECSNLSQFKTDTVGYIAGFIVRKLSAKLSCSECVSSLKASESDDPNLLIISRGSHLTSPSLFVKKIAVTCEKVLSTELENNWLSKKYYFDFVQILICNSFVSLHSEMFRNLDCHSYELLNKNSWDTK